jgi:hypothetical protein
MHDILGETTMRLMVMMFFVGSMRRNLWWSRGRLAVCKVCFWGGWARRPFTIVFPALHDCADGNGEVNGDGSRHSSWQRGCGGWWTRRARRSGGLKVVGYSGRYGGFDEPFVEFGIEGLVDYVVQRVL